MDKYQKKDLIVKMGKFRLYFQNYYTIISLANDILLGGLYLIGSIASILSWPAWIQKWSYLAGAVFLLMRPLLKIIRNVFIYDKKEFQNKVSDVGYDGKDLNKDDDYGETKSQKEKMDKIHQKE